MDIFPVPALEAEWRYSTIDTFECGICLERYALEHRIQFPVCSHSFCYNCATQGIEQSINQNMVPVACFAFDQDQGKKCGAPIEIGFILEKKLVSEQPLETYRRRLVLADPHKGECPNPICHSIETQSDLTEDGHPKPDIQCSKCQQVFCLIHSASHQGQSCAEYLLHASKEDKNKETILLLKRDAKECPNVKCKIWISKNGGCNHMTCSQCETNFCWLCLKTIEGGSNPRHFQESLCPQFGDTQRNPYMYCLHVWANKLLRSFIWLMILFPSNLFGSIVGLVIGFPLGILFSIYGCFCCSERDYLTSCVFTCISVCRALLEILLAIPWLLLYILCLGLYFCCRICCELAHNGFNDIDITPDEDNELNDLV